MQKILNKIRFQNSPRPEVIYVILVLIATFWGFHQEGLIFKKKTIKIENKSEISTNPNLLEERKANSNQVNLSLSQQKNTNPEFNQDLTLKPQKNSLENTLDSINAGSKEEDLIAQRKSYFNKLSEQLNTFQGQATSSQNAAPNQAVSPSILQEEPENTIIPHSGGGFSQNTPIAPDEEEADAEEEEEEEEEEDDDDDVDLEEDIEEDIEE